MSLSIVTGERFEKGCISPDPAAPGELWLAGVWEGAGKLWGTPKSFHRFLRWKFRCTVLIPPGSLPSGLRVSEGLPAVSVAS